jgi:hypothetical protein
MNHRVLVALLCTAIFASPATAKHPLKNPFKNSNSWCDTDFAEYKRWPSHKAFASTGNVKQFLYGNGFSCGSSFNFGTKKEAIEDALRRCERVRSSNKFRGKCKIIVAK